MPLMVSLMILLCSLLSGCKSAKEPLIQLREYDSATGTNVHSDDKPLYREVTDEFGVVKKWKF